MTDVNKYAPLLTIFAKNVDKKMRHAERARIIGLTKEKVYRAG